MKLPSRMRVYVLAAGLAIVGGPESDLVAADRGASSIELTWMSIANWYFQVGDLKIVMDGYISRVPGPPFFVPSPRFQNDMYATTLGPRTVETGSIRRVIDALPVRGRLDYLLTGHSHFDHSWDTPTWAKLTAASLIGGLSSCYQAEAQGLPPRRCRAVNGGEAIRLADGVTLRVVRFNHSGDDTNPIQHFARELSGPPMPDPATNGLRAGVGEDYPNGGGGRAFLLTVDDGSNRLSLFVQNSASAFDLDEPIVVDGVDYGAPLDNLAAAMRDAQLESVDVWIGTGGLPVARLIVPIIKPKTYIPNHWDGLFNNFWAGMPFPYKDDALKGFLDARGIALLPQQQYFDKYRLDARGVTKVENHAVKRALGFSDEQPFDAPTLAAVARVGSTVLGDDCGEGRIETPWARSTFAHRHDVRSDYFMFAVR